MRGAFRLAAVLSVVAAAVPVVSAAAAPKYAAKVPPSIQTSGTVKTRLGTLHFFDGLPDQATVQKVYDNLDFSRGVEAFLAGMPAASVYALCQG